MMLYLARRWCAHGQHEKPTDSFRPLPGGTRKRMVCQQCYEKIMEERERRKVKKKV
jgi:hypothetical protein